MGQEALAPHRALDLHEATGQRDLRLLPTPVEQPGPAGRSLEPQERLLCAEHSQNQGQALSTWLQEPGEQVYEELDA